MTRWQVFLIKMFMMDAYSYRNMVWEDIFLWCDLPEYWMWIEADNDNDYCRIVPPSGGTP